MLDTQDFTAKSDAELVKLTLENPDIYAVLVDRYKDPLLRYITRLGCRNIEDARDVLQEVFIKAYVNLNDFDDNYKFSAWAYRIAHNQTVSFFRKMNIRPRALESEDQLIMLENLKDDRDIAADLDQRLNAEMLDKAFGEMDARYRDVLTLKYLEEKSYQEISDILKMPISTVGTNISRGKQKLKQILIRLNFKL